MQFSKAAQTIIERGKAAYKRRIDRHQDDLNDWWAIGEALFEPERELLHELGLNRPEDGGKRWAQAWGDFLRESGFIHIHKTTRSRLRSCIENRVDIEDWLSKMDNRERVHLNHPSTIWQRWSKDFGVTASKRKGRSKIEEMTDANRKLQEERDRLQAKLEEKYWEITRIKRRAAKRHLRTGDPACNWTKDPLTSGLRMATEFPAEAKALAEIIIGTFAEINAAEIARAQTMTLNDDADEVDVKTEIERAELVS